MSLPELQSLIASALGRPGDSASSSTTATLHSKLNQVMTQLPVGLSASNFQSGTISIASSQGSGTATISPVDTTRTIVLLLGQVTGTGSTVDSFTTLTLTSSTVVTASRDAGFTTNATVGFLVITFNNVKSLQTGTVTITDNGSNLSSTTAITSVNTSKAFVVWQGCRGEYGGAAYNLLTGMARLELTNATTVTATRTQDPNAGGSLKTVFSVVEFN